MLLRFSLLLVIACYSGSSYCQEDSVYKPLPGIPAKFFKSISSRAENYMGRIKSKTVKTLEKLARWELKIKHLLERANPETAQQLFNGDMPSFASLLEKYKEGEALFSQHTTQYNEYRDQLENTLKYMYRQKDELSDEKVQSLTAAREQLGHLNSELEYNGQVEQYIKERKKQLLEHAVRYLGKNRYLKKINQESYYYFETLANYKELFSSPGKAEQAVLALLQKIPAFSRFLQKNTMLASLFRMPGDPAVNAGIAGLQTRAQVTGIIQQQLAAGGPSAVQQFRENLQSAQAHITRLKDKVMKYNAGGSNDELPNGFKPNPQKSKTFWQRVETGTNIQFQRSRNFFPATGDIGLSVGYKLNDKSIIGIGGSYKLGMGSGWNHIRFTQQGAGLRGFIDWKLKGNFWITGGYEQNYRPLLLTAGPVAQANSLPWQESGLLGIGKKIPVKTKFFKKTQLQILWDFLSYRQTPRTQPIVFRAGYNF